MKETPTLNAFIIGLDGKEYVIDVKDAYITAWAQPCDLCGSHGGTTLIIEHCRVMPELEGIEITLKEW